MEVLVSLARAIYDERFSSALIGTVPVRKDAPRVLDEFLISRLGVSGDTQSLRNARRLLDEAVSIQGNRINEPQEAAVCLEATTAITKTIAAIVGVRLELFERAS